MSEKNPTGIEKPNPIYDAISKKPIIVVIGLVVFIVLLLLFSIFNTPTKDKTKEAEVVLNPTTNVTTTTDEEGLNLPKPPEHSGFLSKAITEELEETKTEKSQHEPIQVVYTKTTELSEKDLAIAKREEAVLQYKLEMDMQALKSPLLAYGKSGERLESTGRGTATNSSGDARIEALAQDKEAFINNQNNSNNSQETGQNLSANDPKSLDPLWSNGHKLMGTNDLCIKTGAVIPTVLLTGINSTLPGQIIGQVSQNVWDTATGKNLLIPQGTRAVGLYKNEVNFGQERLFVAWQRLVFPDGRTLTLDNFNGADQLGYAGLTDEVNNHYWKIYGHAFLMSLITGSTAYAIDTLDNNSGDYDSDNPDFTNSMGSALANQMSQTTSELLRKHMQIAPTITVRSGYRLNIIVVKDLDFIEPWKPVF